MNSVEIKHSLVEHHLSVLRNKNTTSDIFRNSLSFLTEIMFLEFSKNLMLKKINIETPLETCESYILDERLTIVPILRAGLAMSDKISHLYPNLSFGYIAITRNEETREANVFYKKIKEDLSNEHCVIVDPMLATGGSSLKTIHELKNRKAKKITLLTIISSPEGIQAINKEHKEITVYTCKIDQKLDSNAYIRPGLGDAGDRLYNT